MMNKIELRLKAHSHNDGITYLILEIKVDGKLLTDFECYATDLDALTRSIESDGEFFIITCWCGIPECAGIKQGLKICHENNFTYWQVHQPEPKRAFVFEHTAYEQAIREVIKQGTHLIDYLRVDPNAEWVFVVDQLNTHQSESLVRWVAEQCALTTDLGEKGKSGILRSMDTRKAFLEDATHRIRFVYTPKHTSWLNQVEIWFSILVRRLLKRASFASLEDLEQQLLAFIRYFNETMAKPFKWTFTGKPLAA